MSHRVRLTWQTRTKEIVVEECDLISSDDPAFISGHASDQEGILERMSHNGMTVFEDDDGIFALEQSQIVKVERLD